jgi:cyanophycinase
MSQYKNYIIAGCFALFYSLIIYFNYIEINRGGTILLGGGEPPRQAIDWAYQHSAGGYFLVITCHYLNEERWKERLEGYEFKSIVLHSKEDSTLQNNINLVKRAAVILIDGGNQYHYVQLLKGTPLNQAINKAIQNKTPIGGISAGCALLGEFYFSAKDGTIDSEDCQKENLNIEKDFFNIKQLKGIFVDTHYSDREREGRLLNFLSEIGNNQSITGIGIDADTALCMSRQGNVVYGSGKVFTINLTKKQLK